MLATDFTRSTHAYRKFAKRADADGFVRVDGDWPLWKLERGGCWGCKVVDTRIDPEGRQVWVKIQHDHE